MRRKNREQILVKIQQFFSIFKRVPFSVDTFQTTLFQNMLPSFCTNMHIFVFGKCGHF